MKVLWVCNIMLPVIAEALHKEASNKEGWLSGLLEQVAAENSNDLELAVAFPVPADTEVPRRLQIAMPREKEDREHLQTNTDAETYNITCYGFCEDTVGSNRTCRQYHRKNRLGQGSDYRVESQGTLLYDE